MKENFNLWCIQIKALLGTLDVWKLVQDGFINLVWRKKHKWIKKQQNNSNIKEKRRMPYSQFTKSLAKCSLRLLLRQRYQRRHGTLYKRTR